MPYTSKNITGISVYSDFDGTIVRQDLGNEMFIKYGQFQPYNTLLKSGEMDIKDYWHTLCRTLSLPDDIIKQYGFFSQEFFKNFIDEFDIDVNFPTFYNFCRNQNIELSIISDGFVNYILPVLDKIGINNTAIFANKLIIGSNTVTPHFYGASESCECMCASCKRNSVISCAPGDNVLVYIGDGHSDLCAAEHCDIIFAKSALSAYLNEKRIPHYNFSNFFDVYRIFSNLVTNGKYKIRHQAFLNRKRAFERE